MGLLSHGLIEFCDQGRLRNNEKRISSFVTDFKACLSIYNTVKMPRYIKMNAIRQFN